MATHNARWHRLPSIGARILEPLLNGPALGDLGGAVVTLPCLPSIDKPCPQAAASIRVVSNPEPSPQQPTPSAPCIGVVWSPYEPKSLWGAVAAATSTLWLPALVAEREWEIFRATRILTVDETHLFVGVLAFFAGPVPSSGVSKADSGELVRVLNHVARLRSWPSLETGVLHLVPGWVRDFGLRLTRTALDTALQISPDSAPMRHDALIVSWRMLELQAGTPLAAERAADILRSYPPDWAEGLSPQRQELVGLILFGALVLVGHRAEAGRFFESTLGRWLKTEVSVEPLRALTSGVGDPLRRDWWLLGPSAGVHIDVASCETTVLVHPPRSVRLPKRLRKMR